MADNTMEVNNAALFAFTMHLSDAEMGLYVRILIMMWRSERSEIAEDDRRLASIIRGSSGARRFKQLVDDGFLEVSDGKVRLGYQGDYIVNWSLHPSRALSSDWRSIRRIIFARDGHECAYCGTTEGPFEIDHKTPRSRGGTNDPENLAVACRTCNRSKRAMTVEEWLAAVNG